MIIKVNLKGTVDKVGVLNKILDDLKINTSPRQSFDGFNDWMRSIAWESEIWRDKYNLIKDKIQASDLQQEEKKYWDEICLLDPSLRELHLMLYNILEFKQNDPEGYKILLEILEEKTHQKNRYDKVIFSYEVHDGEMPS